MPGFRDLMMLSRAPLAITALADGLAGFSLGLASTSLSTNHLAEASLVGLGSCGAYLGGMVFNDVFDHKRDQTLAPRRPIPSGRVSLKLAITLGVLLLTLPLLAGALLSQAALIMALSLVLAVLAYDGLLKSWRLPGCLAMASCRAANILFGGAAACASLGPELWHLDHSKSPLLLALASLIYIFALTWLSTYEDDEAPKSHLIGATLLLLSAPIALLVRAGSPRLEALWIAGAALELVLIGLILSLIRAALQQGTVKTGHNTTRWLIRGTLPLAAGALVLAGDWPLALFNLALAVPYVLGARWLFKPPTS